MPSSQYTVVRIKRKATEAPLNSLLIGDVDEGRHEREREGRRKRRDIGGGRSRGVFRLAETVTKEWQGHGEEGDALTTRIKGLLAASSGQGSGVQGNSTPGSTSSNSHADTTTVEPSASSSTPHKPQGAPARVNRSASQTPPHSLLAQAQAPRQPSPRAHASALATKYRIVPRSTTRRKRDDGLPPRVITLAEIQAARTQLALVDAQAVTPEPGSVMPGAGAAEDDPQMARFQSMLMEYLTLESERKPPMKPAEAEHDTEDEYVYDLYYHDVNADSTELDVLGGDVGALLGYDDLSPPSTPSDSEPEDEADEDSNDEDYYANDYPEDEDADEDMHGFHDAYSDGEWSRSEDEEREHSDDDDPWSYR